VLASTFGAPFLVVHLQLILCVFGEPITLSSSAAEAGLEGICFLFEATSWLGVRWERRMARVNTLPGVIGANDDDTPGCHFPSWRRR
jgi:hypothetical protein